MPRTPVAALCLLGIAISFALPTAAAFAEASPQATGYIAAGQEVKKSVKSELASLEKQWKGKSEARCVKVEGSKIPKKKRFGVILGAVFAVPLGDAIIIGAKAYSAYSAQLQAIPSTNAVLSQGAAAIADEATILKPLGEVPPASLCQYFKLAVKAHGNSKVLGKLYGKQLEKALGSLKKSAPTYKARLAADKAAIAAAGQEMLTLGIPAQQEEEWVKISTFSEEGESSSFRG